MSERKNGHKENFFFLLGKISEIESNRIWHLQDGEVERRSKLIQDQARILAEWGEDIKSFPLVALGFTSTLEGNSNRNIRKELARRTIYATLYPRTKDFKFGRDDGMIFRLVCAIKASRYIIG